MCHSLLTTNKNCQPAPLTLITFDLSRSICCLFFEYKYNTIQITICNAPYFARRIRGLSQKCNVIVTADRNFYTVYCLILNDITCVLVLGVYRCFEVVKVWALDWTVLQLMLAPLSHLTMTLFWSRLFLMLVTMKVPVLKWFEHWENSGPEESRYSHRCLCHFSS